jgi:hypothetical protein
LLPEIHLKVQEVFTTKKIKKNVSKRFLTKLKKKPVPFTHLLLPGVHFKVQEAFATKEDKKER